MTDWELLARHIGEATGRPLEAGPPRGLGGGSISNAVRLDDGERSFFVKLNRPDLLPMFEAEEQGLREIAATNSIRVPEPICSGVAGDQAYLVLEYLELSQARDSDGPAAAGRQLAALHRRGRDRFGWDRDNTIGSTPQPNTPDADWTRFFRGRRLGFQLELAARNAAVRRCWSDSPI